VAARAWAFSSVASFEAGYGWPTLQLPPERNREMASMVWVGTWAPAALSR
jgi:hypothetical protein